MMINIGLKLGFKILILEQFILFLSQTCKKTLIKILTIVDKLVKKWKLKKILLVKILL